MSAYTSDMVKLSSVQLTNIVSVSPSHISESETEILLNIGTAETRLPKDNTNMNTKNICPDFIIIST